MSWCCVFCFSILSHCSEQEASFAAELYVLCWDDNNVSNLVTLHTELSSMLMMGQPPPCSTEMLTFNLCTVISLPRTWNWCTLFPLIKSKNSWGSRQVWSRGGGACSHIQPHHKGLAESRTNQGFCLSFCDNLCVLKCFLCMKSISNLNYNHKTDGNEVK